jgi:hypothetical protein
VLGPARSWVVRLWGLGLVSVLSVPMRDLPAPFTIGLGMGPSRRWRS